MEGNINLTGSPNAINIEKNYYSIDTANVLSKDSATGITDYANHNGQPPYNNNPSSNTGANSAKIYRLKATTGGGVTGLGIALKVMAGDTIDIFGKSYYFQNNTGTNNYNVPVLSILNGFAGSPSGATAGKVTGSQLNGISVITNAVGDFLTDDDRDDDGTSTTPKAYINYILFDDQFHYVSGNFSRVGSSGSVKSHHNDAVLQNINVLKNGYLYVYVSNESPVNVFFDNLQVIHSRGSLLEETHYYPFGLTMAGISSMAMGKMENKHKFNDGSELEKKEFSDGNGLELYSTEFRNYDPQIGRLLQIDPLAELSDNWSPYVYAMITLFY